MDGPLLVIDAPSLLYRAFHALPSSIENNALLGCKAAWVSVSPFGSYDGNQLVPGGYRAMGWTIDPSTTSSISVRGYLDKVGEQASVPDPTKYQVPFPVVLDTDLSACKALGVACTDPPPEGAFSWT